MGNDFYLVANVDFRFHLGISFSLSGQGIARSALWLGPIFLFSFLHLLFIMWNAETCLLVLSRPHRLMRRWRAEDLETGLW
jgi:hypothetical protein